MNTKKALEIWNRMTPEERDYDRFVARKIPPGTSWGAETLGGLKMAEEQSRFRSEEGGCTCHINPPCNWCIYSSASYCEDC